MTYRIAHKSRINMLPILTKAMPLIFGLFMVTNSATASTASILLNGSFELPTVPVNSLAFVTPTSWSVASGLTGAIINGSFSTPEGPWMLPLDGQQYADIGNSSSALPLSQSFAIANNGTYQLAWSDATHSTAPSSVYLMNVIDSSLQTVASENLDAAAHAGVWQDQSLLLNLVVGNYTLTFSPVAGVYDTLLDKVTLTTSPVPIPAAVWLFGSALAGLGFFGKRRVA